MLTRVGSVAGPRKKSVQKNLAADFTARKFRSNWCGFYFSDPRVNVPLLSGYPSTPPDASAGASSSYCAGPQLDALLGGVAI